jgi:ribosomal-protein-alanine N-acetyltransferase
MTAMPREEWLLAAADISDVDRLMPVMTAAFDPRFGEAWTASQLRTLFAVPGAILTLAWQNGAIAGFYAARLAGPESELLLLAVAPQQRRGGIGRALLDHWLAWARGAGASDFFLEMRADNPARHLYEQASFAECGRRPDYYQGQDGVRRDAITMRYLTL